MTPDFSAITGSPRYQADLQAKRVPRWLYWLPPLWPLLLLWFIVRIPLLAAQQRERQTALATFATQNRFFYQGIAAQVGEVQGLAKAQSLHLPYEVITIGRIMDRMVGTLRGMTFEYVSATVKLALLGKDRPGSGLPVAVTFFRMQLPVRVPRLYIESRTGYHRGEKLPSAGFNKPYSYVLEGNFRNYYNVIGEKDERLDIYQVLTPEVMQALVDHAFYDIWLHDQELLLVAYGAGRQQYFQRTPTACSTALLLTREIDRLSRAFRHTEFPQSQSN
jgi:hypothetical protein